MENHRSPEREGGEPPLREWQKETWIGPVPGAENPFDEPEDAPELREMRSENLTNRRGAFWDNGGTSQITGGYRFSAGHTGSQPESAGKTAGRAASGTARQTGVHQPAAGRREGMDGKEEEKPGRKRLSILLGIAAAAILSAVLYYGVFSVREIRIVGNRQIPASEIIRLSGLRNGMPIFPIRGEDVEKRLKQNPVLKFRYLEKELPGTVVLSVREREACCWMTWNGILYAMDKQRMVLYETEDLTVRPANLVRVDGLDIRSTARLGQILILENQQQAIFSNLFLEMKVLSCTELIEEADLSNISSLLLTTRDGFTVAMGDGTNIHAKLRAMLVTREELLSRDYHGGVINVSLPETPIFSPAAGT